MASIDEFIGRDISHKSDWQVGPAGDLDTISGLANLKLALFHRLVTSPGAFIHLPNYGIGIKDFQNAPMTVTNQTMLIKRIEAQFPQDPRVERVRRVLLSIDDDTPDKITIIVKVDVVGYGEAEMNFVPFGESV